MKNLNPLVCVEINEFDAIKNSKNNRAALNLLRPRVAIHYANYIANFPNIHTIGNSGFSPSENADLLKCYTGKTNALSSLISRINKAQTVELQYICGYCLYHTVSTIDHYVPEDEYPVFCVMPRNLVPCCASCNAIKNRYWRGATERWFIHLYQDLIPNLPFLTGTLTMNGVLPAIQYNLVQPVGMSNQDFDLISSHFSRLGLLKLYGDNISNVIGEIKKSVANARVVQPVLSTAEIARVMQSVATTGRMSFGLNYWQSLAIDLLANSQPFLQTL